MTDDLRPDLRELVGRDLTRYWNTEDVASPSIGELLTEWARDVQRAEADLKATCDERDAARREAERLRDNTERVGRLSFVVRHAEGEGAEPRPDGSYITPAETVPHYDAHSVGRPPNPETVTTWAVGSEGVKHPVPQPDSAFRCRHGTITLESDDCPTAGSHRCLCVDEACNAVGKPGVSRAEFDALRNLTLALANTVILDVDSFPTRREVLRALREKVEASK